MDISEGIGVRRNLSHILRPCKRQRPGKHLAISPTTGKNPVQLHVLYLSTSDGTFPISPRRDSSLLSSAKDGELLTLDAICSGLRFQKSIAEGWIKV